MRHVSVLMLATLLVGCVQYYYTPTTSKRAAARQSRCRFDLLTARPGQPFKELGVLEPGGVAAFSAGEFKALVRPHVCAAGGDAVLAEVNGRGGYIRGTVVQYTAPE